MVFLPDYLTPAALAQRPLYAPLAPLLRATGDRLPALAQLNRIVHANTPGLCNGQGVPLRFVPPSEREGPYEHAVFADGDVATRADNWHDFFNALVWAAFPRAKAALNARHASELTPGNQAVRRARGAVRDALTQFDECGMVVVGTERGPLEALARHEWLGALWHGGARLMSTSRFVLFGHATYDLLRRPCPGLCAKTLYLVVPEDFMRQSSEAMLAAVDGWLAKLLSDDHALRSPAAFAPLPLLGIPGVVADNAVYDYYLDERQFRPLRGRAPVRVKYWSGETADAL